MRIIILILLVRLNYIMCGVCNRMPHYGFSFNYPSFANKNYSQSFIYLDEAVDSNLTKMAWLVNAKCNASYFRIYNVITGVVEFSCYITTVSNPSCCLRIYFSSDFDMLENCYHRLYLKRIVSENFVLVFEASHGEHFQWRHLAVDIFLQTPLGLRRYFFHKNRAMTGLVCSEIARSGHASTSEELTRLVSEPEYNTIEFETYEKNLLTVTTENEIQLRLNTFTIPSNEAEAYLVNYEPETKRIFLKKVDKQQPAQIVLKVNQFTEKIQFIDDYEKHFEQHLFHLNVERQTCALLIIVCDQKLSWKSDIEELMYQFIVERNRQAKLTWNHGHSPAIRIVRLLVTNYAIWYGGDRVGVLLPGKADWRADCMRFNPTEKRYTKTDRFVIDLKSNEIIMPYASISDSATYECHLDGWPIPLFSNYTIVVLPNPNEFVLTISSEKNTMSLTKSFHPIVLMSNLIIGCTADLSTSYEKEDKIFAEDLHVWSREKEPLHWMETKSSMVSHSVMRRTDLYSLEPCDFGEYFFEHEVVCTYAHAIPRGTGVREKTVHRTAIKQSIFHIAEQKPYIMEQTIRMHTPSMNEALQASQITHDHPWIPLKRVHLSSQVSIIQGEVSVVHLRDSGWLMAWMLNETNSSMKYVECGINRTRLTEDHSISSVFLENPSHTDQLSVWKYSFLCIRDRSVSNLFGIGAFNAIGISTNRHEVLESILPFIVGKSNGYPGMSSIQFAIRAVWVGTYNWETSVHIHTSASTVPEEKLTLFNDHIRSSQMSILYNFIHQGERNWSAVDFHRTGSKDYHMEEIVNVSALLHSDLTQSGATLLVWTIKRLSSKSHTSDSCPLIQREFIESQYYPLDVSIKLGYRGSVVKNTFRCNIQMDHVALLFVAFPKLSATEGLILSLQKSIRSHVTYWMRHPRSTVPGRLFETLNVEFRIQRLRVGWNASINEGESWRIVIGHSQFGSLSTNYTHCLCCLHRTLSNAKWKEIWSSCGEVPFYFQSSESAKVGHTGWYKCEYRTSDKNEVSDEVLVEPRKMIVIPKETRMRMQFTFVEIDESGSNRTIETVSSPILFEPEQQGFIQCSLITSVTLSQMGRLKIQLSSGNGAATDPEKYVKFEVKDQIDDDLHDGSGRKQHLITYVLSTVSNWDGTVAPHRLNATCLFELSETSEYYWDMNQLTWRQALTATLDIHINYPIVPLIRNSWIQIKPRELEQAIRASLNNPRRWDDIKITPSVLLPEDIELEMNILASHPTKDIIVRVIFYTIRYRDRKIMLETCQLERMQRISKPNIAYEVQHLGISSHGVIRVTNFTFRCSSPNGIIAIGLIANVAGVETNVLNNLVHLLESQNNGMAVRPIQILTTVVTFDKSAYYRVVRVHQVEEVDKTMSIEKEVVILPPQVDGDSCGGIYYEPAKQEDGVCG